MKTEISDFSFKFTGYGHYQVTYTSPTTGKQWVKTCDCMPMIDATKNADNPKRVDLNHLKQFVKR